METVVEIAERIRQRKAEQAGEAVDVADHLKVEAECIPGEIQAEERAADVGYAIHPHGKENPEVERD